MANTSEASGSYQLKNSSPRVVSRRSLVYGKMKFTCCSSNCLGPDCRDEQVEPVKVKVKYKFTELVFNIAMRMVTGKRYNGKDVGLFRDTLSEVMELLRNSNLADYLQVFQWVDVHAVKRKMGRLKKEMDKFLQFLVDEHRKIGKEKGEKKPLIDVMLLLQKTEPEMFTDKTIKAVILTMLAATTETSTVAIEWAMSVLLNHPESMRRCLPKLTLVGQGRLLEEQDLPKLTHLQNVVDETLRLYPPSPFLLPHESLKDSTVCGFHVPRGTMLLVNSWAIHRDPELWEDSSEFKPERFGRVGGDGYKLIPFGAGRRACPGASLGRRVVGLALGASIQSFEWERECKEEVDMKEGSGLTIPKAEPLVALSRTRGAIVGLLSKL